MVTNRQRVAFLLMLAWLAASAATVAERHQDYSAKPPFSAETFWERVLRFAQRARGLRHQGAV